MLNKLTAGDFAPHVNEMFHVSGASTGPFDMELTEVSVIGRAAGASGATAGRQPFSLVFMGPGQSVLPQGICEIAHEQLGTLNIFLVPLGPDNDGKGMRYEAIFS